MIKKEINLISNFKFEILARVIPVVSSIEQNLSFVYNILLHLEISLYLIKLRTIV